MGSLEPRPLRYLARLTIDPARDVFQGSLEVEIEVPTPTSCVLLDAVGISVRTARVTTSVGAEDATWTYVDDHVRVCFADPIPPGEARIKLDYDGTLDDSGSSGLFRQRDHGQPFLFTHFEPIGARRVFPCFDQPSHKVPWVLTLEVPDDVIAVANAPARAITKRARSVEYEFSATPPIPTYALAFAIGPFIVHDGGTVDSIPIRALTTREGTVSTLLRTHRDLLPRFAAYLAQPYAYVKLDIVVIPHTDGWGGMENPGLITYGRNALEATLTTPDRSQRALAGLVAHELAHMWFGNLVTMREWRDVWLSEGLAEWIKIAVLRQWHPAWDVNTDLVAARVGVMAADDGRLPAIRRTATSDPRQLFDAVTYQKGPAVAEMMSAWWGEPKFRRMLRAYLSNFAHRSASIDDFVALARQAHGPSALALAAFLAEPGVPSVHLDLRCTTTSRTVRITRASQNTAPAEIPVCLRYDRQTESALCRLVGAEPEVVQLDTSACPKWILGNAGASGYYRVLYTDGAFAQLMSSWALLVEAERLQTFSDAEAALDDGQLSFGALARALPLITSGPSPRLRFRVAQSLAGYTELLDTPSERAHYSVFVRSLFGTAARGLGFEPPGGTDDSRGLERNWTVSLVAIEGADADLGAEAVQRVTSWLQGGATLPAATRYLIALSAARHASPKLVALLTSHLHSTSSDDRDLLVDILGGLRDPALATTVLGMCGGLLTGEDCVRIVLGLATDPLTRSIAYTFARSALIDGRPWLSAELRPRLLEVAGALCDSALVRDARERLTPLAGEDTASALEEMLAKATRCVERRERLRPGVTTALADLAAAKR